MYLKTAVLKVAKTETKLLTAGVCFHPERPAGFYFIPDLFLKMTSC